MILLDYSQVIFGQVFVDLKRNGGTISIDLVRHLVLNQIATYNNRFSRKYGQMVICIDSRRGYWRKKAFEYYKWKRSQDRDDSDIDWKELFKDMNQIREEVIEQVPLMTFEVDTYEADDLIAALSREFRGEKNLIISSDKDFKQLQRFPNIDQYSPIIQKFLKCDDPDYYRFEHTIKGDTGDGIPNIYTREDFFPAKADGFVKRQKSVYEEQTKELYSRYLQGERLDNMLTEEQYARWQQNKMLVDLVDTSDSEYNDHDFIIGQFYDQVDDHLSSYYNLYGFMMKNRLRRLMENLQEFQNTNDFPKRPEEGDDLRSFMQ